MHSVPQGKSLFAAGAVQHKGTVNFSSNSEIIIFPFFTPKWHSRWHHFSKRFYLSRISVNKNISVIIPFSYGYSYKDEGSCPEHIIEEICSLSGKIPFAFGKEKFFPQIDLVMRKDMFKKLSQYFQYNSIIERDSAFIRFNFSFKQRIAILEERKKKLKIGDNLVYNNHLMGKLSDLFSLFLLMLNIARPGGVSAGGWYVTVNRKHRNEWYHRLERTNGTNVDWLLWGDDSNENSNIKDLDILQTWRWFTENMPLMYGKIQTPISRALHAYSKLLETSSCTCGELQLLWPMVGLEAIFTDDSVNEESLSSQIVTKSNLLFKDIVNSKKIKNMYKIRSKFIHGKLNSTILIEDVFEEEKIMDRYDLPIADAATLATTLLISALQLFISNGWNDVRFDRKILLEGKTIPAQD